MELRHFARGGVEDAAEALGVHPNTMIHDWSLARAWLRRELERSAGDEGGTVEED
ncbi:MAG TPA: ECF-type sigma factor [Bryobacteraceae bacterium]|nr:ECF-type sigma factor [Bryobacteraceae bacterium]